MWVLDLLCPRQPTQHLYLNNAQCTRFCNCSVEKQSKCCCCLCRDENRVPPWPPSFCPRRFVLIKGDVNQLQVEVEVIRHVAGERQGLMLNQQIPAGISETQEQLKARYIKDDSLKSGRLSPTGNRINSNLRFLSLSQADTKSLPVTQNEEKNKSILSELFQAFSQLLSGNWKRQRGATWSQRGSPPERLFSGLLR